MKKNFENTTSITQRDSSDPKINQRPFFNFSVPFFLVITSMIGTGVFTSLGFQVIHIKSAPAILLLWIIGAIIALTGAMTYAEISTRLKKSGGEYYYLSEIYHPALGFLAGWISVIVGFSAPLAAVSMVIGSHLSPFINTAPFNISVLFLFIIVCIGLMGHKVSGSIINLFTFLKIVLILLVCLSPMYSSHFIPSSVSFIPEKSDWDYIFHPSFAVSLVYVSYSYSGWNASSYIAGMIKNPEKNLPRSLIYGTLFVAGLYIILNAFFLYTVNFENLAGKIDVANIALIKVLGKEGAFAFSIILSLVLFSTMSGLILSGPKVLERMGEDYYAIRIFNKKDKKGTPFYAIILQGIIAFTLVGTSSFQSVIKYIGITLSIFSLLTVIGIFKLRREQNLSIYHFRSWGYPFSPLIFIVFNLYIISFLTLENPNILFWSFLTCMTGLPFYYLFSKNKN